MPELRQTSFARGELAPTLWGRTDLEAYAHGLRRCYNFFISKHGAAVTRPGTHHVRQTGMGIFGAGSSLGGAHALIPFKVSETESYVIELGNPGAQFGGAYTRFHRLGKTLLADGTLSLTGTPYNPATKHPYATADMPHLRWVQSGNFLIVTHYNHAPRVLRRNGTADWAWSTLSFDVPEYSGRYAVHMERTPPPADVYPKREWRHRVSLVMRRRDGTFYETKAQLVTEIAIPNVVGGITQSFPNDRKHPLVTIPDDPYAITDEHPIKVDFSLGTGLLAVSEDSDTQVRTRVYRGRGKIFGLVGETDVPQNVSGGRQFVDYGDAPNLADPPPEGQNPFQVFNAQGAELRVEDPLAVAFHDDRLVFLGTTERPAHLFASAAGDYFDHDRRYFTIAEAAFDRELAVRTLEQIRDVVSLGRLLVFTDAAVHAVSGAGGAPLAADGLQEDRVQSSAGASWLRPLVMPGAVLYGREMGKGVRDLVFSNEAQAYVDQDLSFIAQHLFVGREIRSWGHQESPWDVIWGALSDGKLLSLTYDRGQGVVAWGQHETAGEVENVCVVREGDEDAVYMVVKRTPPVGLTTWSVERMASRRVENVEDAVCLDAAVTYAGAAATVITGLSHLNGRTVTAVADGNVVRDLLVADGQVTLPRAASKVHVGIPFTAELSLLAIPQNRNKPWIVKRLAWEVEASRGLWTGEDFDRLQEWKQRKVEDAWGPVPLFTGLVPVSVSGKWQHHGYAVLRQVDPFPVTVVGVTREVEGGT